MNRAQLLTAIGQATGLNRETIKDLLKKGWVFDRHATAERMAFYSPKEN